VGLLVGNNYSFGQGFVYVFRAVLGSHSRFFAEDPEDRLPKLALGRHLAKLVSIAIEVVGICYLFWPIAVLWMYFSSYATHLEREIQLSMFHFCIPAIAGQVMLCIAKWPLLTSHNVDDDLRNETFLKLLTVSINVTIIVLYPGYLISSNGTLILMSPGIWLLLFAPVLIFAVGVLLPFLTGNLPVQGAARRSDTMDARLDLTDAGQLRIDSNRG